MPMVEMPRWVLPATILGSSLSFIDGSVVNVALPAMQRDFRADLATMQLIVNGYMLMLASLILLGGSVGDRFGRSRIFLIGLCCFAGRHSLAVSRLQLNGSSLRVSYKDAPPLCWFQRVWR
jgi:MFS family permease